MPTKLVIGINEAAARLNMLPRTVRRHCANGVAGTMIGRDWVLTEADLKKLAPLKDRLRGNPDFKKQRKKRPNS